MASTASSPTHNNSSSSTGPATPELLKKPKLVPLQRPSFTSRTSSQSTSSQADKDKQETNDDHEQAPAQDQDQDQSASSSLQPRQTDEDPLASSIISLLDLPEQAKSSN